jgi:hypothetical protein
MLLVSLYKKVLTGFLLFISLFIISISCDSTEPPTNISLTLKLEEVSCTEAWLQLTTNNIQLPATINLLKNNSVTQTFSLGTKDSLLYIDSLLPNQNYSFQVSNIHNPVSSSKVPVITLDTTSHNFTWQTFTFGQHSSSTLYDVAIINENDIWAVGEIYMNDSLGNPDPNSYNAVHWDGTNWELKKVGGYGGWACRTVFAFSENDVWFDGTIKWDGANYSLHNNGFPLEPNGDGWQINKMWGGGSNNLYAVGNIGNIAHYNGSNWKKIESGTVVDFQDVWGIENKDGNVIKYIAADNHMLKLDADNKVVYVNVAPNMILLSVWGKTPYLLYTAGNGAVLYKNYEWDSLNISSINHMYKVRGQDFNDVYGISSPGNIINHFNGYSWSSIETESENKYWTLSVSGNTIVAVGYQLEQSVITVFNK